MKLLLRCLHLALFLPAAAAASLAQEPIHTAPGGSYGGQFGSSVLVAGDVDGDGYDEIAIGIPFDCTNGVNAGAVRLYSVRTATTLWTVYGQSDEERFGHSLAIAGFVNGDAVQDIAVGSPYASPSGASSGRVRILNAVSGAILNTLNGAAAGDRFGWSIRALTVGNGLGGPPLLAIGAPYSNFGATDGGAVYIRFTDGGLPNFANHVLGGSQAGMHFGWSLASRSEPGGTFPLSYTEVTLLIGAPEFDTAAGSSAGRVEARRILQLTLGPTNTNDLIGVRDGQLAGDRFGAAMDAIVSAGAQFAVGAPSGADGGKLHFVRAVVGSAVSILFTITGNGEFGAAVAAAGSIGGGSDEDVVVGAPGSSGTAGAESGNVQVYDSGTHAFLGLVHGAYANGRFGAVVAGGAKFDTDSLSDFVVAAPEADVAGTNDGLVNCHRGSSGFSKIVGLTGALVGDGCGRSVTGIGDVNADGVPDWIVGSPVDTQVTLFPFATVNERVGSARVVSGATGSTLRTHYGSAFGDELGWSTAATGDLNLDGIPDYVVGAPQRAGSVPAAGYARAYSGANGALLYTMSGVAAGSEFGFSVGGGSDLNGDARVDVLVGAPGNTLGAVYGFSGVSGAQIGVVSGVASGDRFGHAVAGLGDDLTADGKDEYVVGAPGQDAAGSGAGRVYVMRSITSFLTKWIFDGTAASDALGTSVARAGDLNRDGVVDIVAGAPGHDGGSPLFNNGGLARAWSGKTGVILFTTSTGAGTTNSGTSVAGVGDVDNDGYDDVAVGAPGIGMTASSAGLVRIHSGKTGSTVLVVLGEFTGESFGTSVAGAGDLDGDGIPDLVAGAPGSDVSGPNAGLARSISLRPAGVTFYGTGKPGCTGPEFLSTNGVPSLGSTTFGLRCDHAPPSSVGLGLVTSASDPVGSDLFGIGVPLLVDLLTSVELYTLDFTSDATGHGAAASPVPSNPFYLGHTYYVQVIWAWGGACSLPPYGLSSSSGVKLVIQ